MRDAIINCYYNPNKLEFLNDILQLLSTSYNVPSTKIRDSLNSSIRTFNSTHSLEHSHYLYNVLYNGNNNISLKNFIEKIVIYLLKTKRKDHIS